ncbi:MAG: hypothetical protein KA125_16395 [Chromatiaceae bacterium]|jgi:hypothetical protein|nr:hypothetical protein [Chromatiaceae bacterium]
MTPNDFIRKWHGVTQTERASSQSHFIGLCRLLDLPDPIAADPQGEWFCFEKGATKAGGGDGWADVWRRSCFGWEYKRPGGNLKKAINARLHLLAWPCVARASLSSDRPRSTIRYFTEVSYFSSH